MPVIHAPKFPAYCQHKATGLGYVTLNGRVIYLGKYGSAASRAEYDRTIAEWISHGRTLPTAPHQTNVAEVVSAFRTFARNYYRDAEGKVSQTVDNFDQSIRVLVKHYGKTPAVEFGPLRLQTLRDEMVKIGWSRTNINQHVNRIRAVFKWAGARELIPATVHTNLMTVEGLKLGRCSAKESEPVKPVPVEFVDATLPHLSRQVAAMVRLQKHTGMRPGEVVLMRAMDIDTTGNLWVYTPAKHKTQIHGHTRQIYFGPRAQEIIKPFLKPDLTAYLFSPAEAETERRAKLHRRRLNGGTPLSCGNKPGSNTKRKAKRVPGNCYRVSAYCNAVRHGCDKADAWAKGGRVIANDDRIIPRWHVNQLRHTAATELRKQFGLEVAQVILGHTQVSATQIYAEKNAEVGKRVMAQVG